MNARLRHGIEYLGREISATRDEFHAANGHGSAMLLDGLLGGGYAVQKADRVALTERGRRALADVSTTPGA